MGRWRGLELARALGRVALQGSGSALGAAGSEQREKVLFRGRKYYVCTTRVTFFKLNPRRIGCA